MGRKKDAAQPLALIDHLDLLEPDLDKLIGVITSGEAAKYTTWQLTIEDTDYTYAMDEASWGRESGDAPGILLEAQIADIVPDRAKLESVRLDLIIAGVRVPGFRGEALVLRPSVGRTQVRAVTAGYWLTVQLLGQTFDYFDAEPWQVVFDLLDRNGRYDRTKIFVEEVVTPRFRAADDGTIFRMIDTLADPLAAIGEQADYLFRDTALNGHIATVVRSPAEMPEPLFTYHVGRDIPLEDFAPEPMGGEYNDVLAYREVDDVVEELARVKVHGSKAPENATYPIEITDETTSAEDNGWFRAYTTASRFEHGEFATSFTVPWINPLVGDGDPIAIVHEVQEKRRKLLRTYYAQIITQKPKLREITQDFEVSMVVAREDILEDPLWLPREESRAYKPPIGIASGTEQPYLSAELPWVEDLGDRVRIDVGRAAIFGVTVADLDSTTVRIYR